MHDAEEPVSREELRAVEQRKVKQSILLDELCAQVRIRSEGGGAEQRWYLDSGANNHMTGDKGAFSELDDSVLGSVKFYSGLSLDIRGLGTIIFRCQNGKHRAQMDVYYISKL